MNRANNCFVKDLLLNEVKVGQAILVEGRWSKVLASPRWDRQYFYFETDHPDYRGIEPYAYARGRKIKVLHFLRKPKDEDE